MKKFTAISISFVLFISIIIVYGYFQPSIALNQKNFYPIIVVGSTPEGISAAVAASRNGTKTLLIDTSTKVGGLITLGKLNTLDMNYGPNNELLTKGIFEEFFQLNNEKTSLDINEAEKAFNTLIANETNLNLLLGLEEITPIVENDKINGVEIKHQNGATEIIYSDYFIDATEDADFAFSSGASFTIGQEDFGGPKHGMAVTLVFELANVNWEKVQAFLTDDNNPYSGADETSAWGYGEIMKSYQASDNNIRVRGLNIGRQTNGNVLINSIHIFEVNGLEQESLQAADQRAKQEITHIINYLNENAPGFENAAFVGTADKLYVRETRHLNGLYRLTIDDVMEHRNFADKIAVGSYPVDIQATSILDWGNVVGNPAMYSIPFRSLVPKEVNNLLVVGRSASFDSLAAGSARVIPVGMATGQAGGTAASYAYKNKLNFHDFASDKLHIGQLQNILKEQHAYIENFDYNAPIRGHWSYEGLKYLRRFNLIKGGYKNDYRLDNLILEKEFYDLVEKLSLLKKLENPLTGEWQEGKVLTLPKVSLYIKPEALEFLPENAENLNSNQEITRAMACMIIKELTD